MIGTFIFFEKVQHGTTLCKQKTINIFKYIFCCSLAFPFLYWAVNFLCFIDNFYNGVHCMFSCSGTSEKIFLSQFSFQTRFTVYDWISFNSWNGEEYISHTAQIAYPRTWRVAGLQAELFYVREGVINEYALNFVVPVPAHINDLHFTWQSLAGRPVSTSSNQRL
jgi:hypothetical protein